MAEPAENPTAEPAETRVVEDAPLSAPPGGSPGGGTSEGGASTPTEDVDDGNTVEPAPDPRIGELTAERDALAAKVAELEAAAERREGMLRDRSESAAQAERDAHMASQAVQEAAAEREALMSQWTAEASKLAILEALKGHKFIGNTEEQRAKACRDFLRIAAPDIIPERVDGRWVVKTRDGRTVADFIAASVDEYGYFFAASVRGGPGTDGSRDARYMPQPQPGSFEAILARFKSQR